MSVVAWEFYSPRRQYLLGPPYPPTGTDQPGQAEHHVLFQVAVEQEVTADGDLTGTPRFAPALLQILQHVGKPERGRDLGVDGERLHRAERMHIDRAAGRCRQPPAC